MKPSIKNHQVIKNNKQKLLCQCVFLSMLTLTACSKNEPANQHPTNTSPSAAPTQINPTGGASNSGNAVLKDKSDANALPESSKAISDAELEAVYQGYVAQFGQDYAACGKSDVYLPTDNCGEADDANSDLTEPKQLNVELILDASGSMAAKSGDTTRMQAAADAMLAFADMLPKNTQLAFRVYMDTKAQTLRLTSLYLALEQSGLSTLAV